MTKSKTRSTRWLFALILAGSLAGITGQQAWGAVPSGLGGSPSAAPADLEVKTIGYWISPGYPGSGYREGDRALAEWAFNAWEKAAGSGLRLVPVMEQEAAIRLYWQSSGRGMYGQVRTILDKGERAAAVLVRPSLRGLGADIESLAAGDELFRATVVYLTCLHEIGHALGLEHTGDERDIMYWFGYGGDIPGFFLRYRARLTDRDDMRDVSGLSEADVNRLRTLYPAPERSAQEYRPDSG